MADDPDPPRKFYQLKPTEFERLNETPAADPAAPPPPPDAGPTRPSDANAPIDVRDLAAKGAEGSAPLGNNTPSNRPNDVHAMLQQNLAAANAAGLNELSPKRRKKSKRLRDYWLLMIPVNSFLAYMAFGPNANVVTFVYGLAGMGAFTASLTWLMFFVMEDY